MKNLESSAASTEIESNEENNYEQTETTLLKAENTEIEETIDINAVINDAQSVVNEYFSVYDYQGACDYLTEMCNTYYEVVELQNMLNNLGTSFENYIMENAKGEFENKNYDSAVSILSAGINILGEENQELNNMYNEYRLYIPLYINELEYFNKNKECEISTDNDDDIKDNTGHEYRHCYFLRDNWDEEEDWAEYLINGNYNTFSGTVGVSYCQRDTDLTKYFEVYGDGKLLYTSPTMSSGSMPEEFSIDVTGVKVLKIWYPPSDGTNAMAVIYEGLLSRNN